MASIHDIEPGKSVLILIDLQKDIVGRFPDGPAVVTNASKACEMCRNRGISVMFVKVERRSDFTDVVDVFTDEVLQKPELMPSRRRLVIEGTEGAKIADELAPKPGDYVIVKRRTSAFYGTSLEIYLRARGISTLLIGGIATNMGVESTVRDARDRDFNVIVLSDCCTTMPPEAHEYAIKKMLPRLARVRTLKEVFSQ